MFVCRSVSYFAKHRDTAIIGLRFYAKKMRMGKIRKSGNVLAIFLCGVVLIFSNTAVFAAASNNSSAPKTAPGSTQDLKISPVRNDLTVSAGTTGYVKVLVSNLTAAPLTVQPIENDFVSGGEQGQPALILDPSSYAPSHSLKRFMMPLGTVTLPPNGGANVTVSIKVPKGAQAGGYFGAIRFVPALGGSSSAASSAVLGESVASLILMTVPGPTVESLMLTNFEVQQNGSTSSNFRSPNNLNLFMRFENKGNLQEAPFGQIDVQKGKKVVYSYNFNETDPKNEILPDGFRRWSIPLKGMGKFGKYNISATLSYGTKGQSIDITKSIWIIPTTYIVAFFVIILVLAVLIGGTWIFLKSYKRRILKSSRRRY